MTTTAPTKCPEGIGFLRLDVIAECYDGVPRELIKKLWDITSECEKNGSACPLGGDGSNGTTEEPIIGGGYANELSEAWGRFTNDEKLTLIKVTALEDY